MEESVVYRQTGSLANSGAGRWGKGQYGGKYVIRSVYLSDELCFYVTPPVHQWERLIGWVRNLKRLNRMVVEAA